MSSQIAFYALSLISVLGALLMVLHRNAVFSVLSLILTFFAIAGHYFLLNAQFLAAVHVIVYAGAIMVLFLYVIFMLNLNQDAEPVQPLMNRVLSVIAAAGLGLLMWLGLGRVPVPMSDQLTSFNADDIGMVETLGNALYLKYMVPFEISAVLFLSAMVGAVMIGRREA
jgi:NADH-quinone oxidoreductase subunit J